jgi:Xaa-Pro dipeptidase
MNLEAIQEELREERLDGWLFYDHHGRDPLAYRILGLPIESKPTRRWYYFIPAVGEPQKLVHKIESHVLQALPGTTGFYSQWTEQIIGIEHLLKKSRLIAMQYSPQCAIPYVSMIDAGTLELVRRAGVEVVSSANLVQLFEARWSQSQFESHLTAGRIMDKLRADAFRYIVDSSDPTEFSVCNFLREAFAANNLTTDHGPIVAVNENASDPHYEPTIDRSSPIKPGDLVLIDMWAKLNIPESVYYDITWTGFRGVDPPSAITNVFAVVKDARDKAVSFVQEMTRGGRALSGYEVDDVARGYIAQQGFAEHFIHRTGHSIGTSVHGSGANLDNFETHDERHIVPGTGFSVEPGIYLKAFGIRSEVNVYVSEHDAIVTGEAQESLLILNS